MINDGIRYKWDQFAVFVAFVRWWIVNRYWAWYKLRIFMILCLSHCANVPFKLCPSRSLCVVKVNFKFNRSFNIFCLFWVIIGNLSYGSFVGLHSSPFSFCGQPVFLYVLLTIIAAQLRLCTATTTELILIVIISIVEPNQIGLKMWNDVCKHSIQIW